MEELIGVSSAAKILGVSVNTVRRLADSGKLPCIRIKETNFRKFKRQDIIEYKQEFYNLKPKDIFLNQTQISLDLNSKKNIKMKNIKAKSHPSHYLMHKYWGRKPHNVIADYISNYTSKNDLVLDPFMGSGIVPIEAMKQKRLGIGVDINPMSLFIGQNTVSDVDLEKYKLECESIIEDLKLEWNYLYETRCPLCNNTAHIEIGIWSSDKLTRIKGRCSTDGIFVKNVDLDDIEKIQNINELRRKFDINNDISYPKDKVLKYVKRSGKETLDELFTDRALIILSKLRDRIQSVDDEDLRKLLMFTFTSMLANVSNMLPADLEKATYKSGWVISKFWTPKIHTERNIFHCFHLRSKAIYKGKNELTQFDNNYIELYQKDSNNLSFLADESIDYIFTDPPYGESIAYLALSQFWNSWLNFDIDYDNEIIIDTYRKKDYIDYDSRMSQAFKEMYRVLKNEHYLSFTFHNRDLLVWKAVMDSVRESGFILKDITLQEQAVSSGTQGINKMNTLTGDFVYTLYKDTECESEGYNYPKDAKKFIEDYIEQVISESEGITPTKLYEILIPKIIHNNCYIDEENNVIDIETILNENYEYIKKETTGKLGDNYQWQKRK